MTERDRERDRERQRVRQREAEGSEREREKTDLPKLYAYNYVNTLWKIVSISY